MPRHDAAVYSRLAFTCPEKYSQNNKEDLKYLYNVKSFFYRQYRDRDAERGAK